MTNSKKWYVVWEGTESGICETWEECYLRTHNHPGARYKAFDSARDAIEAYRRGVDVANDPYAMIRAIVHAETSEVNYANFPDIYPGSVAVCAFSADAGRVGYRGVDVWSGAELFRFGPIAGSANTGEFLAIVHALALLHGQGKFRTAIYCSNGIALSWVKKKKSNAQISQTPAFEQMAQLLARADRWLQTHDFQNFVLKWKSDEWGDNPAGAAKAEQ